MADPTQCPVPTVRPVLVAAAQFDAKNPVVAYYLRMHALNQLMAQAGQNPGVKPFLMALLGKVEGDKGRLGNELSSANGRMALTDAALRLFTSADDMERATAQPSEKAAQLFFVSSVLFEATGQFNDGKMDPIAAEKHKYARYVTALMRKSLSHGAPYVSPSGGAEASALESPNLGGPMEGHQPAPQHVSPQPPGASFSQSTGSVPPPPQQPPQSYHQQPPSPPPPQQPQAPPPQAYTAPPPPPPAAAPEQPPQRAPVPAAASSSGIERVSARDGKAKTDRIIGAEKHARQAIAALQFFDEHTARAQLQRAIDALDGKP
eukprot:CAMPEP_0174850934 /NCGR_PEP_ID=MMETSP1114-20130205/21212_1 /TAXON_ID=312471 /ORGANISM="Neobodo designis, Strain CCAP 1951/1" /LENGTH=318 /DNA_ID=CAMNT_0016085425 /DNA_START=34 /DNA_END=990 /DNA_ORIENTATION=+